MSSGRQSLRVAQRMKLLTHPDPDAPWHFAQFTFQPRQRLLRSAAAVLPLGSRALDILQALLENAGDYVSKEALTARVWPQTVVADITLRVHIAALRRSLGQQRKGPQYIINHPQHGYCLTVAVHRVLPQTPARRPERHNLPARLSPLLGREALLDHLQRQLPFQGVTTLTGPAGVGKSSLALALAERVIAYYPDGAWVLDISGMPRAEQWPAELADCLGLPHAANLDALCEQLANLQLLLVLDGCDHQMSVCRQWVRALRQAAPGVAVLLTSREALGLNLEAVHTLPGLALAPAHSHASPSLSLEEVLQYPAVQLFVERAHAGIDALHLREQDAPVLQHICQRLDGIPLALELAAAQVPALGLQGVQAQLDDGLHWLGKGRRTAAIRHQSMIAALDWSHTRLSALERQLFRQLAVFERSFTADQAATHTGGSADELEHLLSRLAGQSLLVLERRPGPRRYQYLNVLRCYARQPLPGMARLVRAISSVAI